MMVLDKNTQIMNNSPNSVQAKGINEFRFYSGDSGYHGLIDMLHKEIESGDRQKFCEKLNSFYSETYGDMRSLEDKLISGGLENKLHYAKSLEAKANKKITALSVYRSGEDLIVEMLSFIYIQFNNVVKEMLSEGKGMSDVQKYIVNSITGELKTKILYNTILTTAEIDGMIYHLAQKCFIDWDG